MRFMFFESTQTGEEGMIREIHECGCWERHELRMLLVTLFIVYMITDANEGEGG